MMPIVVSLAAGCLAAALCLNAWWFFESRERPVAWACIDWSFHGLRDARHIRWSYSITIDLDALEKLADEATPGPWAWVGDDLKSVSDSSIVIADLGHDGMWIPTEGADAAFIATANPATIKALIAELKEAKNLLSKARGDLYIDHDGIAMLDRINAFLARNKKRDGQ